MTNWLTPDGNLIKGQGVTPDLEVVQPAGSKHVSTELLRNLTAEQFGTIEDDQFLKALDYLGVELRAAPILNAAPHDFMTYD